mmetsp:Transcript_20008/g.27800  ORF Transcript_20008/g.27800 Transcript_20008/m.27800 type:complete len:128 (-) Transcript_20008:20-403(-)
MMTIRESDLEDGRKITFSTIKRDFESYGNHPKGAEGHVVAVENRPDHIKNCPLETLVPPRINPYEQVELHKNYGETMPAQFAAITCPKPSDHVLQEVSKEKESNEEKKGKKKEQKARVREMVNKIVN